jgi:outer membrane protein OmpA-like peptidoglycan-associated protein
MRSLRPLACALLSALSVAAAGGLAEAQGLEPQRAVGFGINRFDPSDRGSEWFALDSLDMRGHLRLAAGLVNDYAYKPLVLYSADGQEQAAIVEHQVFWHLGAAVTLFNKLKIGLDFPLAIYNSGDTGSIEGGQAGTRDDFVFDAPHGRPLGDLRLTGTYKVFGAYKQVLTVAAGASIYLPTGDTASYTGDDSVRFMPFGLAAGSKGILTYAGKLGIMIRPGAAEGGGFDDASGSELSFGVSGGARIMGGKLVVGPEIYGTTVFTEFASNRATAVDVLLGGHYVLPKLGPLPEGFRAGAALGPGLSHGIGTPVLRFVASVEWVAPYTDVIAKPSDRDGDSVLDKEDACPEEPGVRSPNPRRNGCPPPPDDKDSDGIFDRQDACPTEPGPANRDPKKHGCPLPPDRDKDTFLDPVDACPDQPGLANEDPKKHGCPPPPDTDGDSFLDPVDACPDKPGLANEDPKKHGCPRAIVEKGQIRILEQVKFKTGKADILPESEPILEAVVKVLNENPQILKLRVEGHTDNVGNKTLNKLLSNSRAASVMKWLTTHGVDKKRLTSQGWGQEKPIAANDTEEGRKENRRVEFHIVEEKKAEEKKAEEKKQ